MTFQCCLDERKQAVLKSSLNGIDFLEVEEGQTCLRLHLLKEIFGGEEDPSAANLKISQMMVAVIDGGERITDISVEGLQRDASDRSILNVYVKSPGDFSPYTLRLVKKEDEDLEIEQQKPPVGFDPILSSVSFSFKVRCPGKVDCKTDVLCKREKQEEPDIDYLAKDYASFRRLILDRMSFLMPNWREHSPADLGVALAELLSYVGDYLSYRQDAVATEAYLHTARQRISIRRHCRLVDYFMHEGCNARALVQVLVSADTFLPKGTRLLTQVEGMPDKIPLKDQSKALDQASIVFETMDGYQLHPDHSKMEFYAWGSRECCLPKGATKASLFGDFSTLSNGDFIVFAEVLNPESGEKEDADRSHRHAVRLTKKPVLKEDPIGGLFLEDQNEKAVVVTEIEWAEEDALPFSLCISSVSSKSKGGKQLSGVSAAFGNIVLADHGLRVRSWGEDRVQEADLTDDLKKAMHEQSLTSIEIEHLGKVPKPSLFVVPAKSTNRCLHQDPVPVAPRFNPILKHGPVTQVSMPFLDQSTKKRAAIGPTASAASLFNCQPDEALPDVQVLDEKGNAWRPVADLLSSAATAREFVVEVDDDGAAHLRFGDGTYGSRPESGRSLFATYRVGNGRSGNIGADSLKHVISDEAHVLGVTNLLPGHGGIDPESIEEARQKAPAAFRTQERAVTPDDYARICEQHPQVQKAAATLRWTGSWYTIFLTLDRKGGGEVDSDFEEEISRFMEKYRMAGHDLEIEGPQYVPLEIEMCIHLKDDYLKWDVENAIMQMFSNRVLPDGSLGLFHPDNFSFGQPVYLSRLYEAARSVEGIDWVDITRFQRLGIDSKDGFDKGFLEFNRLEIARLDNDPNYPEHGTFRLGVKAS